MTGDVLEHVEYRLGCEDCCSLRFVLSPEQRAELAAQTGWSARRLETAVRLIEEHGVPHWFVWMGSSVGVWGQHA